MRNFRSAEDTGIFDIGQMTCLVGKNEAGKTAVLTAIYGLRPFADFSYDKVRDYPRRHLVKYEERHGEEEAKIAHTTWKLSAQDVGAVEKSLGEGALTSDVISVESQYESGSTNWTINVD